MAFYKSYVGETGTFDAVAILFQDLHPIYLFLFLLVSVIFLKALVCLNSAMIAGSKELSNSCIWSVRTLGVFSSVSCTSL